MQLNRTTLECIACLTGVMGATIINLSAELREIAFILWIANALIMIPVSMNHKWVGLMFCFYLANSLVGSAKYVLGMTVTNIESVLMIFMAFAIISAVFLFISSQRQAHPQN